MDTWSIENVKAWLVHTQQLDPTTGVVSPVLGFDGNELLSFFDVDNADTRSAYFSGCEPFRLLLLQRKVASDRGKVALYWDDSGTHSHTVRALRFSYESPNSSSHVQQQGMNSPVDTGTPSSTTVTVNNEQEEVLNIDDDATEPMESDLDVATPITAKIRESKHCVSTTPCTAQVRSFRWRGMM